MYAIRSYYEFAAQTTEILEQFQPLALPGTKIVNGRRQNLFRQAEAPGNGKGAACSRHPVVETVGGRQGRIPSYNVCYTKLLRWMAGILAATILMVAAVRRMRV